MPVERSANAPQGGVAFPTSLFEREPDGRDVLAGVAPITHQGIGLLPTWTGAAEMHIWLWRFSLLTLGTLNLSHQPPNGCIELEPRYKALHLRCRERPGGHPRNLFGNFSTTGSCLSLHSSQ